MLTGGGLAGRPAATRLDLPGAGAAPAPVVGGRVAVGAEADPAEGPGGGLPQPAPSEPAWAIPGHRGAWALVLASLALVAALGYRTLIADDPEPVLLLLGLLGVVCSAAVAVFRPERGHVPALVKTMTAWSLALVAGLAGAWFLANSDVRTDHWIGTPVTSAADVEAALTALGGDDVAGAPGPLLIPTGVVVQSLEFLDANNVRVSGYVWQQYGPEIPDDIAQGVIFPEAVAEAYGAEEAYLAEQGGTELVGWYFHATFRQPFYYEEYPFDRQDVWLRLWHPNAERGVLLVPDFAAYRNIDPRALPGLEEQFVYGGWVPEDSGFSYAVQRYNTTFGFATDFEEGALPELYFNVALKRSFLGPFVDQVLFAAAVALMLFLVLALTASDEERKTRFGFSPSGALGATSGLLFAVILKHTQLRTTIGQQGIAYLEALPFLFYLLVPLVALNAIVLASPWQIRFVEWNHNLLPKLLYWPLLLGLLLAITLVVLF